MWLSVCSPKLKIGLNWSYEESRFVPWEKVGACDPESLVGVGVTRVLPSGSDWEIIFLFPFMVVFSKDF